MNRASEAAEEFEGLRLGVRRRGDTMTGNLEISKADPELRLTDTGNSEYSRLTRQDTSNLMTLYNRVSVPAITSYDVTMASGNWMSAANGLLSNANMTFMGWVNVPDVTFAFLAIQDYLTATNGDYLAVDGGKLRWYRQSVAENYLGNTVLSANTWYHIAISWGAGGVKFYVNGSPDGTGASTGTFGNDGVTAINIGNWYAASAYPIGRTDEIKIYWSQLSDANILADYNSGSGYYGDVVGGIKAGWHFNEGSGTSATDFSGNGYTGTFNSAPTWTTGVKANPSATMTEALIIQSQDGSGVGEEGIHTFGDSAGKSIIQGADVLLRQDTFDLSFVYGANRVLTINGNPTLNDWFDQAVKTTSSPTFANLIITAGGDIKPSADSTTALNIAQADGTNFVVFDTTNKFTGFQFATPIAPVSIGGSATDTQLTVGTVDGGASFHSASANNFNFATGARYVAGSWIAKATTCSSFTPNGNQIRFYSASGQTIGNPVTFTYTAYFDEDGLYLQSGKNVVLPSNGYLKQASGSYQIVLVLQSASALAANRALYFDIDGGQRTFKITSTGGLTTARALTVDMNNADRTIALTGDVSLNQNLLTTSSPTFAAATITNGATGTFTTVDGKTVTVTAGIVTSIV